jgi:hypothetical protein
MGNRSRLCPVEPLFRVMDERSTRRFANHISPRRIPSLATFPLHRKSAFVLLPKYNYAPPTSTHLYGAHEYGRRLEASHDDLLFISKIALQAARRHPSVVWNDWASMHAERHKLYNLLCPYLHRSSPGMYCARYLVIYFCIAKHLLGRTHFTRSRSQLRCSRILYSAYENT